jgi:hypothetical protein
MAKTTMAASPEMTNWLFQCVWPKWSRVCRATSDVMRLPATGPMVQKPMAEARPSCGLKSRTSAGVATRIAPSTMPMAQVRAA